jgi:hypothetical protein
VRVRGNEQLIGKEKSQSFVAAAMTLMTVAVEKAEMLMMMTVTAVNGAMGATIVTGERWCGGP